MDVADIALRTKVLEVIGELGRTGRIGYEVSGVGKFGKSSAGVAVVSVYLASELFTQLPQFVLRFL